MTEKRYTIKPQDDLFGVVDNYSADKVCVINGIRTEIEAKWLCKDMNTLNDENEQLKQQLHEIQNSFELNWTQNYEEFNKDKLYLKDTNTKLCLDGENLFIEVYIPQINEYYRFRYRVIGRNLMREFIENYNSKEDIE